MFSTIKRSIYTGAILLAVPLLVSAQFTGGDDGLTQFGTNVVIFVNSVLVPFVFAVALLLFIYGAYLYFIQGGGDPETRKTGKDYMIWAFIALVIMVSVWGITNLIAGGLGLDEDTLDQDLIPFVELR